MSETENTGEKGTAPSKTLHLKQRPTEHGGMVRQSFPHGRSKVVVVEKVKRRAPGHVEPTKPTPAAAAPSTAAPSAAAPSAPAPSSPPPPPPRAERSHAPAPKRGAGVVLRALTDEEREARARALVDARTREEEDRRRAEAEAKARAEREERERAERAAAEARKREEESRLAREAETKRKSEEEARRRLAGGGAPEPQPASAAARPAAAPRPTTTAPREGAPRPAGGAAPQPAGENADAKRLVARRPAGVIAVKAPTPPRPTPSRGGAQKDRGRLTVSTATSEEEERTRSVAAFRRRTQRLKSFGQAEQKEKIAREVILPETITIQELANRMSERGVDVIRLLMKQGALHKITDVIDADTAQLVAEELGHTVKRVAESDVEEGLFDMPDAEDALESRPPVVTIMGHVDHGKTSLLDAIRQANVVAGEAGGITQHIGAYQVTAPNGAPITFIDTPGHAAFTAMRARGAKVTDIVILVVAADDGVMPQTIEAIHHAKAAEVPLIVAINKIDKPDAKPERVRTELLQHEVQTETFGGETLEVEVSAKEKLNLDKLLDAIILQSEVLDLKANPERSAEGTVIEARLDKGRGPVATVLVQRGTLHIGDIIVAGSQWGRVRALLDDKGAVCPSAGPSFPVEILGFSGTPEAGDRVAVVESEARAREITEYRERQRREKLVARGGGARTSLTDMMSQLKTAGRKEFPLVIKGDVQGSVEAIIAALDKLGTDEVGARIVHAGVGGISESDIALAEASNAVVIGFNVRAHKEAREASERGGIEIRYYNIIYNLVDDVKAAMSGLLAPTLRETMLGNAQILEVFDITKVGKVAGCRITDGSVERGANVRLIRDNVVVHEGKLSTLKRFKDEVKEVQAGQECGMAFENYQDMRVGDVIECYRIEEIKRTL
ncbi:translation initiation factor IF-2 [Methylosinus trichosporium]|uniref:Translation initiation factor IF-2 n=1 Tax=Methylosinus trichosporium (strain ATCC 35070 / NCIMB 11131 / UNIQEM 75 / OB3b) TaxID=595536 RepID=A0A2D2D073_METT3|nr:translation initiation factor IF-2 [Methylosinus trichosporium]ATQ68376.1 translation initiation factor IF-2 [Methylosinus trichosporium OB3b]